MTNRPDKAGWLPINQVHVVRAAIDADRIATIRANALANWTPSHATVVKELCDDFQADMQMARGHIAQVESLVKYVTTERDALQAENTRLERMLAGTNVRWSEKLSNAEKGRDRLASQVTDARQWLVGNGTHRSWCKGYDECTCGLNDLLARLTPTEELPT